MEIKKIQKIKKYPYLGYSPNLIEYFLIVGFDQNFKTEKSIEIAFSLKDKNNPLERQQNNQDAEGPDLKEKFNLFKMPNKPIVLNSIASDFRDGMLNEDKIIDYIFPNNYTPVYTSNSKNERFEKNELKNQNLIFYLSMDKIFEKNEDDAQNKEEQNLNKNIMFNVYGYLFWESMVVDNLKVFFPKLFVFISQYSYFKFFSYLSQNILFRIRNLLYFEIPLEIQLYNIINFTPSPLRCDFQMELLANIDLVTLKKIPDKLANYIKYTEGEKGEKTLNDIPNEHNNMSLQQLSGYPYFDIDLSHLFNYFNFERFFITYLFSFLEFKIIFFSPSLEFLNIIMYIIRFFSYPFIDNKDLGQIYAISKEDFLYGIMKENNIIGVNCLYDQNIVIPHIYKDYFIVSFDMKLITMYYNGQNISEYNDKGNNVIKLINFIVNSILEDREKEKFSFLEQKINSMFTSLYQIFRKVMNLNNNNNESNDPNNNSPIRDFFKELDFSESTYKSYDYKYEEFNQNNSDIQKALYKFNLSIYEYLHDSLKLVFNEGKEDNTGYKSIFYEFTFDSYNDKNLLEEEKIFFDYFIKTTKFNQFINLFLKKNICSDLNRPSLICAEEFMNINKELENDESKDYIELLNDLFENENKVVIIEYTKFYKYYSEKLSKIIYNLALDTKILKITNESKGNISRIIYKQKECLLDDNILKRYIYYLNNIDQTELENIFLPLKYKLTENNIQEVNSTFFSDKLEDILLRDKFFRFEDVECFIVLIIYIITLKRNKIIFHFFEEIIANMTINRKICLRKYIYLILFVLNEIVNQKINKEENVIKELLLYKEIMNCIYHTSISNKIKDKFYYLNERLVDIINNFNIYQKNYEKYLQRKTEFQKENKIIIEKYKKNDPKDILEDGVDYKVLLQNNACRDKGTIKEDVLLKIAEGLEFKGMIQTTCKTCQLKIRPNLFFVHVPIDKSGSCPFVSVCYTYKIALDILQVTLNNNFSEKEDDFFNLMANIIFYINNQKGINNKISNYLATCMK